MNKRVAMDFGEFMRHEERVAALPDGVVSVGVGPDLVEKLGVPFRDVAMMFGSVRDYLIDGGADTGRVNGIVFYARRRKKMLDVGSRKDFEDMGWSKLCDLLDEVSRKNGDCR